MAKFILFLLFPFKKSTSLVLFCLVLLPNLLLNFAFSLPLQIDIVGLEGQYKENAENALSIMSLQHREAPDELRLEWLASQGDEEILTALHAFGYFRSTVKHDVKTVPNTIGSNQSLDHQVTSNPKQTSNETSITSASQVENQTAPSTENPTTNKERPSNRRNYDPSANKNMVHILYTVNLGQAIPIANTEITLAGEGKDERFLQRILGRYRFEKGMPLDQQKYEQLKSDLQSAAAVLGYFDADFSKNEILVDLDEYSADIQLTFMTGTRYQYDKINFRGGSLEQALLRRYLNFQEGQAYRDSHLSTLQSNLIASNYFANVAISAPPNKENKTVDVDVDLEMQKKSQYSFGLGYGTDFGARIRGGYEWRYLNKKGHKANFNALIAERNQDVLFEYIIPGKNPITDRWRIYSGVEGEQTNSKDYISMFTGASHTHVNGNFASTYGLEYRIDRFHEYIGNVNTPIKTKLLIPSALWSWKSRRNLRFQQSGAAANLLVRGSFSNVLSDLSFLQSKLYTRFYLPLNEKSRIILRGEAGITLLEDGKDFQQLPSSLRFYAGGDNSVRGYGLDDIGPQDQYGNVIGGKNLLVASLEYEHKIKQNYGMAVFVDAGNAFDDIKWDPKIGAGIGARWYSPIGVVRLDLAHGFDQDLASPVRIHVRIGMDL